MPAEIPAKMPAEMPAEMSTEISISLAVGMTFPSLEIAKDVLLRHTVSRGESYKKHKQTSACYIIVCHSKNQNCPYCI